jgi:hypothetical protein
MGHDAFAHQGLGSSALVIVGALHVRPAQTVSEGSRRLRSAGAAPNVCPRQRASRYTC